MMAYSFEYESGERGDVGVTVGVKRGPSEPGEARNGSWLT